MLNDIFLTPDEKVAKAKLEKYGHMNFDVIQYNKEMNFVRTLNINSAKMTSNEKTAFYYLCTRIRKKIFELGVENVENNYFNNDRFLKIEINLFEIKKYLMNNSTIETEKSCENVIKEFQLKLNSFSSNYKIQLKNGETFDGYMCIFPESFYNENKLIVHVYPKALIFFCHFYNCYTQIDLNIYSKITNKYEKALFQMYKDKCGASGEFRIYENELREYFGLESDVQIKRLTEILKRSCVNLSKRLNKICAKNDKKIFEIQGEQFDFTYSNKKTEKGMLYTITENFTRQEYYSIAVNRKKKKTDDVKCNNKVENITNINRDEFMFFDDLYEDELPFR